MRITGHLLVFIFFLMSVENFAESLALPGLGVPVTLVLPEQASRDFVRVRVTECDAEGNKLRSNESHLMEQAMATPDIHVRKVLRFTPAKGKAVRYFLFDAESGSQPIRLPKENLFPPGDFEGKGWNFGNWNPGVATYGPGRGGGKALQVDTRKINNTKAVFVYTAPPELLKLKNPAKVPALLRVHLLTLAGQGKGAGLNIILRRFNSDYEFLAKYLVQGIQGGTTGEWEEFRFVLNDILPEDTGILEVLLENLAPQDGVCFRIDDLEILPIQPAENFVAIQFPTETTYAGEEFRVAVNASPSKPGCWKLREISIPVQMNGQTTVMPAELVETRPPVLAGGTLTLELYKGGELFLRQSETIADDHAGSISVRPPAGEYRVVATVRIPTGECITREVSCEILDDPFSLE